MKRDMENLNLRDAFKQEPDFCHEALMQAAHSVEEEKQVKRASFRTLIVAAIIIVSMTAVAFAAGQLMGWTDFFGSYSNVGVPQAAVNEMHVENGANCEVGPMTFTVKELMTDGHIVMSSVHIAPTDGSKALICTDLGDVIGCNGENGQALAEKLGIDPMTTYMDAAQQLNLPLYLVRGILDVDAENLDSAMEDPMWNEDGSMTYFSMNFLKQIPAKEAIDNLPYRHTPVNGEDFVAPFYLQVSKINPATGEETDSWINRDQSETIAISGVVEEKTYQPEEVVNFDGFSFQHAHMQLHNTGAYSYIVFEADETATEEDAYTLYELYVKDAQGNLLPEGMDLSTSVDVSAWPRVILTNLHGVDALPESLTLEMGEVTVTAK